MPKVSSPAVLESIANHLEALDAPESIAVWAMIETPAAILNIQDIAKAQRDRRTRLTCFVLGTNDLAKDTWAQLVPGRVPMLPWMMFTLAAARAEGLTILDGVWNDIEDVAGCRAECQQARDLGFDGKTLIHPNQLEPANTCFAPSDEEVAPRPPRHRGLRPRRRTPSAARSRSRAACTSASTSAWRAGR